MCDFEAFCELAGVRALCWDSGIERVSEALVHGEEEVTVLREMEVGLKYRVRSKIVDVVEKGKNTIISVEKDISSGTKEYSKVSTKFVLRGVTAKGYKGCGASVPIDIPK